MNSILMFRLGGLGDLLVAFPAISFVRRRFPESYLALVCRQEYGQLLRELGIVDEVISWSEARFAAIFSHPGRAETQFEAGAEHYHLILGWMQRDGQGVLQEYFQRVRQKRCEFFCFDPNYQGKASRFFFEATVKRFAGRSGVETEFEKYIRLPLSDDQRKRGFNLLRPLPRPGRDFIVVHPGSGSREKCWPLENFLEIVQKLATLGFAGAVVTGEAEERMEKELAAASLPGDWLWLRQPPLLGLAGLLASSRLYLGNDSGVTHLAAACGTPVVAIFKKAFELQWSPYGQASILSGAELSTITIASVQRQILQFFGLRA